MTGWVWGSTRFCVDCTIGELLALSREYVARAGGAR